MLPTIRLGLMVRVLLIRIVNEFQLSTSIRVNLSCPSDKGRRGRVYVRRFACACVRVDYMCMSVDVSSVGITRVCLCIYVGFFHQQMDTGTKRWLGIGCSVPC